MIPRYYKYYKYIAKSVLNVAPPAIIFTEFLQIVTLAIYITTTVINKIIM